MDQGARYYIPSTMQFTSQDPLAIKYPHISPYTYCAANPILYTDPDGRRPRLYINLSGGTGHAFVSTGSKNNLTVYSYGRYGATSGSSSSPRLHSNGEGVLIIKKGKEALNEIKKYISTSGIAFEFPNGDDSAIDSYYNELFNSSNNFPSKGKYVNSNQARVIDQYNVLTNNCVTISLNGLSKGVDNSLIPFGTTDPFSLFTEMNKINSWESISNAILNLLKSDNINVTIRMTDYQTIEDEDNTEKNK